MRLTGMGAALRIARREALRAKGRSALVVALIGLPVVGMGAGAVLYDSFTPTPEQAAQRQLGSADAAVQMLHDRSVTQIPTQLYPVLPDGAEPPEGRPHSAAELREVLPAGTRMIRAQAGTATIGTRTGIATVEVREVDYADPIARGLLTQLSGRAPRDPSEVAVTSAAADRAGVGVGDDLRVVGEQERRFRVVGIVEDPGRLDAQDVIALPGAVLPEQDAGGWWLVDTPEPLTWPDVRRLNQQGMTAISRAVLLDPPPHHQVPLYQLHGGPGADAPGGNDISIAVVLIGAAILQIVLLAGPAFAISARRRQRDLALVAVSGGAPTHLRRIVLADGVVLGLAGAVAGLSAAIAAVAAGLPLIEEHLMDARADELRVFPLALAGIAGLAVLTGVLAALLPAITAARQSVVEALAGRRGITRSRRRWVALGLATAGIGAALATVAAAYRWEAMLIGGLALGELGLAVCTPALIGAVSRISGLLPVAPRMALRNTSRIRSAAAPAIAAVMAAVAAAVTIGVMSASQQAKYAASYQPQLPSGQLSVRLPDPSMAPAGAVTAGQVTRALRDAAPVAEVRTVRQGVCQGDETEVCSVIAEIPPAQRCPYEATMAKRSLTQAEMARFRKDKRCGLDNGRSYGAWPNPVVDEGAVLGLLTGADPEDRSAARQVLERGGAVVGDRRAVRDGRVALVLTRHGGKGQEKRERRITVPGYAPRSGVLPLDGVMLSPAVAQQLALNTADGMVVARPSRPASTADLDRAQAELAALSDTVVLYVENGPGNGVDPWMWVLAGIAGLITLGAAAIATGLVAADGRAELSTLAAVGGAPSLRRALMLSQSGVIAGIGTVLGGLVGIGAAAVLISAMDRAEALDSPMATATPFTLPWQVLLVILVVVPLIAMLGAGAFTRSRLPIERRLT